MKAMPLEVEVQDRTAEIYCKAAQIFHDQSLRPLLDSRALARFEHLLDVDELVKTFEL